MRAWLGIRSAYSFLYGVRMPSDIFARAKASGVETVAICDRDGMYGLPAIIEAAEESGLRAIAGVEFRTWVSSTPGAPASIFAFARNQAGFSRICAILSAMKQSAGESVDPLSGILRDPEGLVLASTDPVTLEGLLPSLAGSEDGSGRKGDGPFLFAAITPSQLSAVPFARQRGLSLLAIDDATFFDELDREAHRTLRAIALGKTIGSLDPGEYGTQGGMLETDWGTRGQGRSWPEAFLNAEKVAKACISAKDLFGNLVFPDFEAIEERRRGSGSMQGTDPINVNAASELFRRVHEGANRRYGILSEKVVNRIDYELDVINRKGFASYFLVMDDIVSMASHTCGRGSGASSIVSYCLGITNVDPIEHNLYFERFLNSSRSDPPDIDVDFAWDEREDLMKAVFERFGPENCARVANHNMFRERSAFRETMKAFGFSDSEIAGGTDPDDEMARRARAIASRIVGLPRGLSMHCGGLVVCPRPVSSYAPVEKSQQGFPLLAWEKEGTEAAGLVKLDLLGNRSLAVIRDALADLERQGIKFDSFAWNPVHDADTVNALARGDSMGVFYIESPAMRQLQKKTAKGDFGHIVIHSSIIRPAANAYITEYVKRLRGAPWQAPHPLLAHIFDETYGILCYQEDVSKSAIALSGFDEAEADALRKIISKKGGPAKLAKYRDRFYEGARENGVDEATIESVWAMILSFEGYSFCKAHSASYAMVSFQSAWLRVHHPAEFMAAVLTNGGGFYRPLAYVSEARRMGLDIAGPDVNSSMYAYRGDGGKQVTVGLVAITGLSRATAEKIVSERRRHGIFLSLGDFLARIAPPRDDILALAVAGALDTFEPRIPRSAILRKALIDQHMRFAKVDARQSLFRTAEGTDPESSWNMALPPPIPRPRAELEEEFASLGFLREMHPLALWKQELSRLNRIPAWNLNQWIGKRISIAGWPITQKEVLTSSGQSMSFYSFEDETALYETVFFPHAYDLYSRFIWNSRPCLVTGIVKDDMGAICVEVDRVDAIP